MLRKWLTDNYIVIKIKLSHRPHFYETIQVYLTIAPTCTGNTIVNAHIRGLVLGLNHNAIIKMCMYLIKVYFTHASAFGIHKKFICSSNHLHTTLFCYFLEIYLPLRNNRSFVGDVTVPWMTNITSSVLSCVITAYGKSMGSGITFWYFPSGEQEEVIWTIGVGIVRVCERPPCPDRWPTSIARFSDAEVTNHYRQRSPSHGSNNFMMPYILEP